MIVLLEVSVLQSTLSTQSILILHFKKGYLLAQNKTVMSIDGEKHLWKSKAVLDLFHLASEKITPFHSTDLQVIFSGLCLRV